MVGWHHQLNGHEFEKLGEMMKDKGSLACCSPRHHKELDTTECTCVHTHIHTAPHSHTHTHTQMRKLKPRGNLPKITEWAGQGRFESSQSGSMVHVLN